MLLLEGLSLRLGVWGVSRLCCRDVNAQKRSLLQPACDPTPHCPTPNSASEAFNKPSEKTHSITWLPKHWIAESTTQAKYASLPHQPLSRSTIAVRRKSSSQNGKSQHKNPNTKPTVHQTTAKADHVFNSCRPLNASTINPQPLVGVDLIPAARMPPTRAATELRSVDSGPARARLGDQELKGPRA